MKAIDSNQCNNLFLKKFFKESIEENTPNMVAKKILRYNEIASEIAKNLTIKGSLKNTTFVKVRQDYSELGSVVCNRINSETTPNEFEEVVSEIPCERCYKISCQGPNGWHALLKTVFVGNLPLFKYILENFKPDLQNIINLAEENDVTPLLAAVLYVIQNLDSQEAEKKGCIMVEELLKNGANPNLAIENSLELSYTYQKEELPVSIPKGATALEIAAEFGITSLVGILLEGGAKIKNNNSKDFLTYSTIGNATIKQAKEILKKIKENL